MKNTRSASLLLCALFFFQFGLYAQDNSTKPVKPKFETDTAYVKSYEREITARIFASQKYTSIQVPGSSTITSFRYRPNTTLNLGVGATYRSFSLNLAYGFPGINKKDGEKGKTKYLDLQAHMYGRKFVIDLFGQFYKGYYINQRNFGINNLNFYTRPDLIVNMVGASGYYVFNNRRVSYRASLIQNEWQKKSAGTFLLGAEVYYGAMKADSTIVPVELASQLPHGSINRLRFINIGPGLGYAYTFVYKENWFATGSLTVNVPIDFVKENSFIEDKNRVSITPNLLYRLALGYNSRRWIYTASHVNGMVSARGTYNNDTYRFHTGNLRFTAAKRFTLTRKGKKIMQPVDKVLSAPAAIGK